jgi:hypothetical protein
VSGVARGEGGRDLGVRPKEEERGGKKGEKEKKEKRKKEVRKRKIREEK